MVDTLKASNQPLESHSRAGFTPYHFNQAVRQEKLKAHRWPLLNQVH